MGLAQDDKPLFLIRPGTKTELCAITKDFPNTKEDPIIVSARVFLFISKHEPGFSDLY